jgi:tRNA threonylcarbamoyladenosine biosynthesis protein TsaE
MIERALPDEAATAALGAELARVLLPRRHGVVYLQGEMGAGKTALARGLLRAAGFGGTMRSPTYTLVEPYAGDSFTVLHLDLYRLTDPSEIEQLGLVDYADTRTIWLVEWPERGRGWLPPADVEVFMSYAGEARRARIALAAGSGIDFN